MLPLPRLAMIDYKTFKDLDRLDGKEGFLAKVSRPLRYATFKSHNWGSSTVFSLRNIPIKLGFSSIEAKWGDPSYARLAHLAYENPYSARALFLASQLMSSVEIGFYRTKIVDGEEVREAVPDHPFIKAFFTRPNPRQGYQSFVNELVNHLYLSGDLIFHSPGSPITGNNRGMPQKGKGIELIRPDRLERIEKDEDGNPRFYHVVNRNGNKKRERIPAGRIIHIKTFNPLDDDRGLPMLLSVYRALILFTKGEDWNLSVFEQRGRIPGYIKWIPPTPSASMDDPRWEEFKRRSIEQFRKASENSYPFFLDGNFDFKEAAHSIRDADWLKISVQKAKEIAAGMGFGPSLLLGEHATYNNLTTDLKAAYTLTVLPILDWWLSELNALLVSRYGVEGFLAYDLNNIEALEEDLNEKAKRLTELVRGSIYSPDEARQDLGKKPRGGMADQLIGSLGMVALDLMDLTVEEGEEGEEEGKGREKFVKLLSAYLDFETESRRNGHYKKAA